MTDLSLFLFVAVIFYTLGNWIGRWRERRLASVETETGIFTDQGSGKRIEDLPELGPFGRIFGGLFLTGWLIAWTFGIVAAGSAFLHVGLSGPGVFLAGWLIAAVAGWFVAVYSLFQIITGRTPFILHRR